MDDDVRKAAVPLPPPTDELSAAAPASDAAPEITPDAVSAAVSAAAPDVAPAPAPAPQGSALPPPIDEAQLPNVFLEDAGENAENAPGKRTGRVGRPRAGENGAGAFGVEKPATGSKKLPKQAVIALIVLGIVLVGVLFTVTVIQSHAKPTEETESETSGKYSLHTGKINEALNIVDYYTKKDPEEEEFDEDLHVIYCDSVNSEQIDKMQIIAVEQFLHEEIPEYAQIQHLHYLGYMVGSGSLMLEHVSDEIRESVVYLVYQVQLVEQTDKGMVDRDYIWYIGFSGVYSDGRVNEHSYTTVSSQVPCDTWSAHGTYSIQTLINDIKTKYISPFVDTSGIHFEDILPPVIVDENEADDKDGGVVFPNSSEELIPEGRIERLSDQELRMAINEIWARHGYTFQNEEIYSYYSNYSWYVPTIPADEWNANGEAKYLNDVELENEKRLVAERERRVASSPAETEPTENVIP